MNLSLAFTRILFMILSIFFMTAYMVSRPEGHSWMNISIGVGLGLILGLLLMGFGRLFSRFNLRAFNIAIIGLFVGYLMGQALVLILSAILKISAASIHLSPDVLEIVEIALFLFGIYLGTLMAIRSSDEFYISVPFIRLSAGEQKKKELLLDLSVLADARILDFAASGIVDDMLVVPRFLVKELYMLSESQDESTKGRAKRSLETLKKLEGLKELGLRYNDTDFSDVKDPMTKMIHLARLLDANMMTADISRVQVSSLEGVRIVNLHTLSNALKPLMQTGEQIKIKILRYGKEPRQGVGYLEDGTMVVVNGGGDYLGKTIDAAVVSVKHTTSGRMIFCNAPDEEGGHHHYDDEGG